MRIDGFKLAHWMNARKFTPDQVAVSAKTDVRTLRQLLQAGVRDAPEETVLRLSEALNVMPEQLAARPGSGMTAVVLTAHELYATRRPIRRAGIHFYNYYSMAAPPGRVAPVILDILCPDGVLPELNNGHLEPAITVNLGPGDIHGRWGKELSPSTWQVLRANSRGPDPWIVGDSYVEPSYCPHSYSLAGTAPARIISYTGASHLAGLLEETNGWTDSAFGRLLDAWDRPSPTAAALAEILDRRGFDAHTAAKTCGLAADAIEGFLDGESDRLDDGALRTLARTLGFDHRVLLSPCVRRDAAGKTCMTVRESRNTIRPFRGYAVASLASAPGLPDLVGLYMSVRGEADGLDLCDHGETHYLVVNGDMTLRWREDGGKVRSAVLGPDGTAWIGSHVEHSWSGHGSLIKLGSGEHLGYLQQFELTNTFAPAATLRRGRRDTLGWGYETTTDA